MCGRLTLSAEQKLLLERFTLTTLPKLIARYNITPSQPILAVREHRYTFERESTFLNWGLVPSWAKSPEIGTKLTNARSETAETKNSFANPLKHSRCLIPTTGFYEWKRTGNHKTPFFFCKPDKTPFALAGLWDHWGSADGSEIESCTILTTSANALMEPIHHRMPVILSEEHYARWLDTDIQSPKKIQGLLTSPPQEDLICYPVSEAVNNAREDGPQLIEECTAHLPPDQADFFSDLN